MAEAWEKLRKYPTHRRTPGERRLWNRVSLRKSRTSQRNKCGASMKHEGEKGKRENQKEAWISSRERGYEKKVIFCGEQRTG